MKATASRGRTLAGPSTSAVGLAMAVTGVMQAARPADADPLGLVGERLILALFAISLVLLVPGLLALAGYGGRAAYAGAVGVSAGHVLLALAATAGAGGAGAGASEGAGEGTGERAGAGAVELWMG
ncbi:hypothetical protein HII36_54565, partial [Nonomuraea sp. NN258]|uniref:hypothetical protein n=1 Tax=Nonomuraea antri TaxID=2730852 RepID=UPI001C2C70F4